MSGYPTRISRTDLGPDLRDEFPAENPETDIPATSINTLFHQVSGLNVANFIRACVIAEWSGSVFVKKYQQEAWNSKQTQTHPALTRTSAGNYQYTFAASYLDEQGIAVSTGLVAAKVTLTAPMPSFATPLYAYAWIDPTAPLVAEVRIYDSGGAPTDAAFILEVG